MPAALPQTKPALRAYARALRAALSVESRAMASHAATQHLLGHELVRNARTIAAYASFGDELETHELITALLAQGKIVALPRVDAARRALDLIPIKNFPANCIPSPFGILEPPPTTLPLPVNTFDVILVPALLFDRAGYRIGYGGGYYDRLLAHEMSAFKMGLGFSAQVISSFIHETWDRPVHGVCTDIGIFFSR